MSSRAVTGGIWKKDSVIDVAESVGINNLPDSVAGALASDVEYRLWQIIEVCSQFISLFLFFETARAIADDVSDRNH